MRKEDWRQHLHPNDPRFGDLPDAPEEEEENEMDQAEWNARKAHIAELNISAELAKITASEVPCAKRVCAKIDFAYELKLIDYPRRDVLIGQAHELVRARREALNEARIKRLQEKQQ